MQAIGYDHVAVYYIYLKPSITELTDVEPNVLSSAM